ncbi:PREDICTED: serine carboxypeptidase-like 11 isoform X2 [Ipomoea nil]|uniref:serine carboxypeptidase-like 11 isoform X2 n=1 Tax=Ipomoea nil TaxID=35883 RepID=UPI0009018E8E|nr:PREDICTED: serine carboxypeptidase-like 11 isoform X2 [Ipomoea nil]
MFSSNLLRRRCCRSLPSLLGSIVVLWFCSSQVLVAMAAAGTKVVYLPRVIHERPLPFELETGYIGVGESEDVQLFYYFVKSESNPSDDPIVVWVSGGPGCSSFFAMTQEIGPLIMDLPKNISVPPTFSLNPYSWTKVASFVYLDLPVGTGFSYAKSAKNYTSNTLEASYHGAEFIRKWLIDYPEYQSNSLYVGGDSYSGTLIPMLAQAISNGNDARLKPAINFKGYLVGNGVTHFSEHDYTYQFALGYGLISEEFAEQSYDDCITNPDKKPFFTKCQLDILRFVMLTFVNNPAYILDSVCLINNGLEDLLSGKAFVPIKRFNGVNAKIYNRYLLCKSDSIAAQYVNVESVQEALHVKKGSIDNWEQCRANLPYNNNVRDSIAYHANLSTKGFRSLIYNGDRDLFIPSLSAEAWTKSLNYSIIDDWRPWFVNNQIVGYTRTFSNNMTYAKIKGSGHLAPSITPVQCFVMFKRWISYEKL